MNEVMDIKLKADLERQLREELKSESDTQAPAATVFALRQKFGLAPLPNAVDIARSLKGTRRSQCPNN